MFYGIIYKSKIKLDNLYKDKDTTYPERKVVEHRFEKCINAIDETMRGGVQPSPYSSKTWFYPFFAVFYDMLFGIGSLLKERPAKKLDSKIIQNIKRIERIIINNRLPEKTVSVLSGRTTNVKTRKELFNFIKKG